MSSFFSPAEITAHCVPVRTGSRTYSRPNTLGADDLQTQSPAVHAWLNPFFRFQYIIHGIYLNMQASSRNNNIILKIVDVVKGVRKKDDKELPTSIKTLLAGAAKTNHQ